MSTERMLSAQLVAAISLYMIRSGPQTLCVKSPFTGTPAQFQRSEMCPGNSKTLRVGI